MEKVVSHQTHQKSSSPQQAPQRPTCYDPWERATKTYCCNHWWKGNFCLYGNHYLNK